MSKIGKTPITLPEKVEIITIDDNKFEIKGPKGSLFFNLPFEFTLEKDEKNVKIIPNFNLENKRKLKALYGTLRSLLNNRIIGVSKGFEKILILEGLGYSAEVNGKKINFKLGFSHQITLDIPDNIEVDLKQEKGKSLIFIKGIDKEAVGIFAAKIKRLKPADRYHAKGFRYFNEVIKLKPVKKTVK